MLTAQRATETVRVQIPHDALWAADFFSEEVRVRRRRRRRPPPSTSTCSRRWTSGWGCCCMAAGEDARVLKPSALIAAGPDLASDLLAHHREI